MDKGAENFLLVNGMERRRRKRIILQCFGAAVMLISVAYLYDVIGWKGIFGLFLWTFGNNIQMRYGK